MGLSENETALAFLELFIQSNSLPKKSLEVVPVLRSDNASHLFLSNIKRMSIQRVHNKKSELIRWSDPVEYIPSNYPKSDAFQIISDIGARLAMSEENAIVFLISSETLPHLIAMSRLNRELRQRKWFVKGKSILKTPDRNNFIFILHYHNDS